MKPKFSHVRHVSNLYKKKERSDIQNLYKTQTTKFWTPKKNKIQDLLEKVYITAIKANNKELGDSY